MQYHWLCLGAVFLGGGALSKSVQRTSPAERLASNASYHYWPVCLYVERGAATSMKEVAETLAHEANKCGVALLIKPTYVSEVPKDLAMLKGRSKDYCKLSDPRLKSSYPRASVIVVVNPQSSLPGKACNSSSEQAGCGEWTAPPSESVQDSLLATGNAMVDEKGTPQTAQPGEETFSVIRGGPLASGAAFQWGVGVALGRLFPGTSLGRGLSDEISGASAAAGSSPSEPLKEGACGSLKLHAYRKAGVAQPDLKNWVVGRDDPSYFLNLATGKYEGGIKSMANAASGAILNGAQKASHALQKAAAELSGLNNLGDTFKEGGGAHKKPARISGAAPTPAETAPSVKPLPGGEGAGAKASNSRPDEPPMAQQLDPNRPNSTEARELATPETAGQPE